MPRAGDVHSCPDCGDWISWHEGFPDRRMPGYWIDLDAEPWPLDEEVPVHHRRFLPHPCLRYLVTGIGGPVAKPDPTPYVDEYVPAVLRRTDADRQEPRPDPAGVDAERRPPVREAPRPEGSPLTGNRQAPWKGRDPKPLTGGVDA